MRATGEPGATHSLIEGSEFVDWDLVVCRVRLCARHGHHVSCENIAQNKQTPRALGCQLLSNYSVITVVTVF
jgi:hypothetical protein